MTLFENLAKKYSSLSKNYKSIFVLVILFLAFYFINLIVTVNNKPESAYNVLNKESSKIKLQDTRVHNWSELDKDKK